MLCFRIKYYSNLSNMENSKTLFNVRRLKSLLTHIIDTTILRVSATEWYDGIVKRSRQ